MAAPEKKVVTFEKQLSPWQPGEIANFDPARADDLVKKEIAHYSTQAELDAYNKQIAADRERGKYV